MTAFDYAKPLATANRLIERYGQLGSIRTPGDGGSGFDPMPGEPTDAPARFAITAYSSRDIDGTRIKAKDKKAVVAPGTLTADPTEQDKLVEADGTVWNIIPPVDILRPAETTLLYTIQCRK